MLPLGFLGTRADMLMDVVLISLLLIIPIIAYSFRLAYIHGEYAKHRQVQLTLGIVLAVVVVVFETDLRLAGGVFRMTAPSRYAGTWLLNSVIWTHIFLAISTTIIWAVLIVASLRKFPNPPKPGRFSATHRLWGRIGMIGMLLTGLTALPLYILGFAF
ncbi:MAG: DUF420 domain-containing protein [Caldilineaceae bacterium]